MMNEWQALHAFLEVRERLSMISDSLDGFGFSELSARVKRLAAMVTEIQGDVETVLKPDEET